MLNSIFTAVTVAVRSALRDYSRAHNVLAAVNRLPPEIFGAICAFLEQSERLTASQVCEQWRLVVFNDPRLWTEHVVGHCGTSALEHYAPLLSRTKHAPLALDITFGEHTRPAATVSGARVAEFSELLFEHMDHVRDLAVRISVEHDLHTVMVALRQPAPLLQALHVSAGPLSKGPRLPPDLLAGCAPLLRRVVLQGIQPPSSPMPALAALRTLALNAYEKLTTTDVEQILRTAPDLRKVAFVAREYAATSDTEDFAFHSELRTLYAEGGTVRSEEELCRSLAVLGAAPSLRDLGIASPSAPEVTWILARAKPCHTLSVVSRTGYSFSLRATSGDQPGRTLRAWRLHLHHFSTIVSAPGLFEHLRELTLAEAVWSESLSPDRPQLPAAPALERLTLVLAVEREYFDSGASWGGNFGGIFQFALRADGANAASVPAWRCPALHTVRLMTSATEGATVARRDVAVLLTCHVRAERLKRLELLRVRLHHHASADAQRQATGTELADCVEEIVVCPESEFDRVWPELFPDLEWTGALGTSDNWITR